MVSEHSNIHRLRPRLRLVIDNADRKAEPDQTFAAENIQGRVPHDGSAPHPAGA